MGFLTYHELANPACDRSPYYRRCWSQKAPRPPGSPAVAGVVVHALVCRAVESRSAMNHKYMFLASLLINSNKIIILDSRSQNMLFHHNS